jgi:hypothetical protein
MYGTAPIVFTVVFSMISLVCLLALAKRAITNPKYNNVFEDVPVIVFAVIVFTLALVLIVARGAYAKGQIDVLSGRSVRYELKENENGSTTWRRIVPEIDYSVWEPSEDDDSTDSNSDEN